MNFSSTEYFVMTAQERSFTRAAERLHITQQTLSAHIANLEREVGSRLFVRSLPLELTYAGQVFGEYAVEFRRKLQSLERSRRCRKTWATMPPLLPWTLTDMSQSICAGRVPTRSTNLWTV